MKNGKFELTDVYLRPLRVEDAELSYIWRNDPRVWAQTVSRPSCVVSLEMERDWVTRVIAEHDSLRFAICLKDGDRYVGNIYLTDIDWEAKVGSQGTFIGDVSVWGKGIGTCARLALHKMVLESYGIRRIRSTIRAGNVASLKSAAKSGFVIVAKDEEFVYLEKNLSV